MVDLVIQNAIRRRYREKGFCCAKATMDRIDELLASIIDESMSRAEKNRRKTVMPQDI